MTLHPIIELNLLRLEDISLSLYFYIILIILIILIIHITLIILIIHHIIGVITHWRVIY